MVRLLLTNEAFEQDIRPLIKSFFPKEELVVSYDGELGEDWKYLLTGEWEEEGFCLSLYKEGKKDMAICAERCTVPLSDRKKYRDEVKRGVYRILSAETKKRAAVGNPDGSASGEAGFGTFGSRRK